MGNLNHALNLPLFGEFADVRAVMDIASAADASGFDGLFVWDHVLSPLPGEWAIADPWVALTAAAVSTTHLKIGTMVTPIGRRRLATLARATQTLNHLSRGRLIVGLGLGGDRGRELSAFGEPDDQLARAKKLSEGASILKQLWAGKTVNQRSEAWVLEDVKFIGAGGPTEVPIWMASTDGAVAPARRAAHFDGLYPINVDVHGFKRLVEVVHAERGSLTGFEFAVASHPSANVDPYIDAGATWLFHAFWPGNTVDQVLRFIGRAELV